MFRSSSRQLHTAASGATPAPVPLENSAAAALRAAAPAGLVTVLTRCCACGSSDAVGVVALSAVVVDAVNPKIAMAAGIVLYYGKVCGNGNGRMSDLGVVWLDPSVPGVCQWYEYSLARNWRW